MERIDSLNKRLDWLTQNSQDLEGVDITKGKFYVHRLDKDTPEEAKKPIVLVCIACYLG
ncbi:hypothetical protein GCM10020331_093230 [Ectobacillus funiculus]